MSNFTAAVSCPTMPGRQDCDTVDLDSHQDFAILSNIQNCGMWCRIHLQLSSFVRSRGLGSLSGQGLGGLSGQGGLGGLGGLGKGRGEAG